VATHPVRAPEAVGEEMPLPARRNFDFDQGEA
jgi:hypothetical protein